MKSLASISLAISLSACNTGIGYVASNYGIADFGEPVHTKDGDFKVWDRTEKHAMLISPTVGEVLSHPERANPDAISVEGGPAAEAARGVARAWFDGQSRKCQILTTREVAHPEFEITYSCP